MLFVSGVAKLSKAHQKEYVLTVGGFSKSYGNLKERNKRT